MALQDHGGCGDMVLSTLAFNLQREKEDSHSPISCRSHINSMPSCCTAIQQALWKEPKVEGETSKKCPQE